MESPSGNTVVRLSLGTFFLVTFAMALMQPVQAGTEEAPEIQDPAGDQAVLGEVGSQGQLAPADIQTVWFGPETAEDLTVSIRAGGPINGGNAQGQPTTYYRFTVTMIIGETTYTAGANVHWQQVAVPEGAASAAAVVDDTLLVLTIPKANLGNPVGGAVATGLFAESAVTAPPAPATLASDRAPDSGAGTDYTFGGPGGPPSCPNCTADDTDGDGLNDTWEVEYFGNITAQNATGDPDDDGLTNGQEQALGTDPTNADTDGDGCDDKVDSAPLDPVAGCSGGSNGTTSTSGTQTSSTTTSGSRTTSTSSTGAGGSDGTEDPCADSDTSDAVDCLESNTGYLGMSAGGFLAVLILCIVALATRWSL